MTQPSATALRSDSGQTSEQRVFIAGASGAIGRQLSALLVAAGWRVGGSTRVAEKLPRLRELGVEAYQVDVYDTERLNAVLKEFRPQVVIHQLTDLPYALASDKMAEHLVRNARIRVEGTRNLVAAAVAAGATRLIAQSLAFVYAEKSGPQVEEDPLLPEDHIPFGRTVTAVKSLERQVLEAPLAGLVLRYGLLYGPGTGFDGPLGPGSVHVEAAAKAAELAVTLGQPGIYNIAEPDGQASTAKAKTLLGWEASWRR